MKMFALGLMLLVLTACTPAPQKTDITANIQSCTVYKDAVDCTLYSGNSMYVNLNNTNIKYDSSAWKENIAYCPKENFTLPDNSTVSVYQLCKNLTIQYCYNSGGWIKC